MLSLEHLPLAARLENLPMGYARYVEKLFWPHPLAVLYPYVFAWPAWEGAGAAVFLAVVTVWVMRRARPAAVSGRGLDVVFGRTGAGERSGAGRPAIHGGPLQLTFRASACLSWRCGWFANGGKRRAGRRRRFWGWRRWGDVFI